MFESKVLSSRLGSARLHSRHCLCAARPHNKLLCLFIRHRFFAEGAKTFAFASPCVGQAQLQLLLPSVDAAAAADTGPTMVREFLFRPRPASDCIITLCPFRGLFKRAI